MKHCAACKPAGRQVLGPAESRRFGGCWSSPVTLIPRESDPPVAYGRFRLAGAMGNAHKREIDRSGPSGRRVVVADVNQCATRLDLSAPSRRLTCHLHACGQHVTAVTSSHETTDERCGWEIAQGQHLRNTQGAACVRWPGGESAIVQHIGQTANSRRPLPTILNRQSSFINSDVPATAGNGHPPAAKWLSLVLPVFSWPACLAGRSRSGIGDRG